MPAVLSNENGKTLSLGQLKPQGVELSLLVGQWRARYNRAMERCCGVFHTWWGDNTDRAPDLVVEIRGFFHGWRELPGPAVQKSISNKLKTKSQAVAKMARENG